MHWQSERRLSKVALYVVSALGIDTRFINLSISETWGEAYRKNHDRAQKEWTAIVGGPTREDQVGGENHPATRSPAECGERTTISEGNHQACHLSEYFCALKLAIMTLSTRISMRHKRISRSAIKLMFQKRQHMTVWRQFVFLTSDTEHRLKYCTRTWIKFGMHKNVVYVQNQCGTHMRMWLLNFLKCTLMYVAGLGAGISFVEAVLMGFILPPTPAQSAVNPPPTSLYASLQWVMSFDQSGNWWENTHHNLNQRPAAWHCNDTQVLAVDYPSNGSRVSLLASSLWGRRLMLGFSSSFYFSKYICSLLITRVHAHADVR